eukprot:CFRG6763T1
MTSPHSCTHTSSTRASSASASSKSSWTYTKNDDGETNSSKKKCQTDYPIAHTHAGTERETPKPADIEPSLVNTSTRAQTNETVMNNVSKLTQHARSGKSAIRKETPYVVNGLGPSTYTFRPTPSDSVPLRSESSPNVLRTSFSSRKFSLLEEELDTTGMIDEKLSRMSSLTSISSLQSTHLNGRYKRSLSESTLLSSLYSMPTAALASITTAIPSAHTAKVKAREPEIFTDTLKHSASTSSAHSIINNKMELGSSVEKLEEDLRSSSSRVLPDKPDAATHSCVSLCTAVCICKNIKVQRSEIIGISGDADIQNSNLPVCGCRNRCDLGSPKETTRDIKYVCTCESRRGCHNACLSIRSVDEERSVVVDSCNTHARMCPCSKNFGDDGSEKKCVRVGKSTSEYVKGNENHKSLGKSETTDIDTNDGTCARVGIHVNVGASKGALERLTRVSTCSVAQSSPLQSPDSKHSSKINHPSTSYTNTPTEHTKSLACDLHTSPSPNTLYTHKRRKGRPKIMYSGRSRFEDIFEWNEDLPEVEGERSPETLLPIILGPIHMEMLVWRGCFMFQDGLLYCVTILPIRFVCSAILGLLSLLTFSFVNPRHIYDVVQGIIIVVSVYMIDVLDINEAYHVVLNLSWTRTWVLYNLFDVCDVIITAVGRRVMGSLMWSIKKKSWYLLLMTILGIIYVSLHSLAMTLKLATLHVAIDRGQLLFALLLAIKMPEFKGGNFNGINRDQLLHICLLDMVDRCKAAVFSLLIFMHKSVRLWHHEPSEWIPELASATFMVLGVEVLVDNIKHIAILTLNGENVNQSDYYYLSLQLAKDLLQWTNKHSLSGLGDCTVSLLSDRFGYVTLPLTCILLRVCLRAISIYEMSWTRLAMLAFPLLIAKLWTRWYLLRTSRVMVRREKLMAREFQTAPVEENMTIISEKIEKKEYDDLNAQANENGSMENVDGKHSVYTSNTNTKTQPKQQYPGMTSDADIEINTQRNRPPDTYNDQPHVLRMNTNAHKYSFCKPSRIRKRAHHLEGEGGHGNAVRHRWSDPNVNKAYMSENVRCRRLCTSITFPHARRTSESNSIYYDSSDNEESDLEFATRNRLQEKHNRNEYNKHFLLDSVGTTVNSCQDLNIASPVNESMKRGRNANDMGLRDVTTLKHRANLSSPAMPVAQRGLCGHAYFNSNCKRCRLARRGTLFHKA